MDSEVAARHTNPSFSFCDMISNQTIVQGQPTRPERARVLEKAIEIVKTEGRDVIKLR